MTVLPPKVEYEKQPTRLGADIQAEEQVQSLTMDGPRLWLLLGGLYLSIYILSLELTVLSTVIPIRTDEFGTVADISWYETSYVLPICILTPIVAKFYNQFRIKHVYLIFMVIFEVGLVVSSIAKSSHLFIVGRTLTGLGAAGQFNGCMLILSTVCDPGVRLLATSIVMSMIPISSMTGPIIAGVLTTRIGWRWSFWILLPIGGAVMVIISLLKISEQMEKPPFRNALEKLPHTLDPVGFILFASFVTMILLALTWGGARFSPPPLSGYSVEVSRRCLLSAGGCGSEAKRP